MSKRKLIRTEALQRASDEVLVLAAKPVNGRITPERVTLANSKYFILQNVAGDNDAYFVRNASDDLLMANLKSGADIIITVTMSSGNQRYIQLAEDGTTNNLLVSFPYETVIATENDDIELRPDGDLVCNEGGGIMMGNLPTSDPANAGQLWNSSGTLKVSAG